MICFYFPLSLNVPLLCQHLGKPPQHFCACIVLFYAFSLPSHSHASPTPIPLRSTACWVSLKSPCAEVSLCCLLGMHGARLLCTEGRGSSVQVSAFCLHSISALLSPGYICNWLLSRAFSMPDSGCAYQLLSPFSNTMNMVLSLSDGRGTYPRHGLLGTWDSCALNSSQHCREEGRACQLLLLPSYSKSMPFIVQ